MQKTDADKGHTQRDKEQAKSKETQNNKDKEQKARSQGRQVGDCKQGRARLVVYVIPHTRACQDLDLATGSRLFM